MKLKYYHILPFLMAVVLQSHAQQADTVIKSNTIEITQSYQPEIKQHPKPVLRPVLPAPDTTHPVFSYEVPQQTLFYTYSSTPLRPLALGKDTTNKFSSRYIKLGGGNLSTFLLEYGEEGRGNNAINPTTQHTLQLHSIYQKGGISNQQTWLSDAHFNGSLDHNDWQWHLALDLLRNQYNYYGYDHDLYQYSSSDVSQIFAGLRATVDVTNKNSGLFHYNPKIITSLYTDNYQAAEKTIGLVLPVTYDIDPSVQLCAAVNGTFTRYEVGDNNAQNNVIQFSPGLIYTKGAFNAHAFINPTIGKDGTYFLPDITASYKLPTNLLTISAGIQGLLRQNSYEQLSTENPYMHNLYDIRQTRSNEIFGNVSAGIGHHIMLSGRFSIWQYNDLPVFVNNSGDQKQFGILYEDQLNAVSFQAAIRYQVSNNFSCGLSATKYSFSNGNLLQVWHIPGTRMKGDLLFHPIPELSITAYLTLLNDINAMDKNGQPIALDGVFDLGGSVEYDIIPRLAVFAQVGNILNNKNERWLGYTSYGFNIFGGIRLKF